MVSPVHTGTLERKIYFYQADIGVDEGGALLPYDPMPALNAIAALPFTNDDSGCYEFDSEGNAVCAIVHSVGQTPSLRFCRIRRTGLPQLENAGRITDLNLAVSTGLLEAIHVVFFPNNIVGAEYNHYGPRMSRLGNYFYTKSNHVVPDAAFRPLLRGDAAEQMDRLYEIRELSFNIRPSYVEELSRAHDSLAETFRATSRVLEHPKTLHLYLNPIASERRNLLDKLVSPIREFLSTPSIRDGIEKLEVRGKCSDSERVETLDLLKDQLISTVQIVRMNERSRALNTNAAFNAIYAAYEDSFDLIQSAASVSP